MKSLTRFVIALGAVAMVAISQAQGFPGGGRQGGGRMMMGMGGGQMSAIFLLQREDVQDDLGITAEQRGQLRDLQEKQMENMRGRFQRGGGGGQGQRPDREAMRAEMEKLQKEMEAEVGKILKPEQSTRLKEIGIQMAGNRAVMQEPVAKELGITADQKTKLDALQTKQREANQAVMERMRNQELDMDQFRATMEKNNKIMDEEIGKVLTETQRTKLKAMGGKPFVRKDDV